MTNGQSVGPYLAGRNGGKEGEKGGGGRGEAKDATEEEEQEEEDQVGEGHGQGRIRLRPKLGLFNGCAVIIGVIVGSGIFISPRGVLLHSSGSPLLSIGIWAGCGLFSLLGALCYAELGTRIPKSGGDYIYIAQAFGPLPAFLFLWVALLIVNPTSNAVIALTFAQYALKPFFPHCSIPNSPVRFIAGCTIALLTFINCASVRWSTRTQSVSTVAKLAALLLIVIAGAIFAIFGDVRTPLDELIQDNSTELSPVRIALAFYSGVFSFSGWNYLNFVTEEIHEPRKNLPRAIYISLPLVTTFYVLVNLAYFAALDPREILDSDAVAVSFAERVMGSAAGMLMPICVACACVGSLNGIIFTSSRMFFAGARDGLLPELLAMIDMRCLTPTPSLIFLGASSIAMLTFADVYVLINYLAFAESAVVTIAVAGLIRLRLRRRTEKVKEQGVIELPLAIPVLFLGLCLYILFVPLLVQPIELIIAIGLICSGVPIYFVFVRWRHKPALLYGHWVDATRGIQKLLLCVTDDRTC